MTPSLAPCPNGVCSIKMSSGRHDEGHVTSTACAGLSLAKRLHKTNVQCPSGSICGTRNRWPTFAIATTRVEALGQIRTEIFAPSTQAVRVLLGRIRAISDSRPLIASQTVIAIRPFSKKKNPKIIKVGAQPSRPCEARVDSNAKRAADYNLNRRPSDFMVNFYERINGP